MLPFLSYNSWIRYPYHVHLELYNSRGNETTAFDQHYFRGRLNTNDGCPKHRGGFRRFSYPFAAVWTMLSRELGWWACRVPRKTSWRISTHFACDVWLSKEEAVGSHYECSVALGNSVDQKLSSHFLIYKKYKTSVLNYITSNSTFKVHVIHIEFVNCTIKEVISIATSMI